MNSIKDTNELQKENSRDEQGAWKDKPIFHATSDQQPKESISSKLWDLDIRIQGSPNSPTSGVVNAKWHAGTSTRISINLNQRACIENHVVSVDMQEQKRR